MTDRAPGREPIVYVVQERRHIDIRPAQDYGPVLSILPESEQMYDMDSATRRILNKLHRFTEHDYILPIGHPTAIALAVAIACRINGGRAKLLVWDGKVGAYSSTQIDISGIPADTEVRL